MLSLGNSRRKEERKEKRKRSSNPVVRKRQFTSVLVKGNHQMRFQVNPTKDRIWKMA
jgi:hypothetical protein